MFWELGSLLSIATTRFRIMVFFGAESAIQAGKIKERHFTLCTTLR